MFRARFNRKGLALVIVLGTILVVTSLSIVILSIISTNSRLISHQTGRMQAYYAAMAGLNYGLDKLRTRSWIAGTDCKPGSACTYTFEDGDFKPSVLANPVNGVSITIRLAGEANCPSPPALPGSTCVSATTDYSYTAP